MLLIAPVVCVLLLVGTSLGLVLMKLVDSAIRHFEPDYPVKSTVERVLVMCLFNVWWLCGFKALFLWAVLTLGLWPVLFGLYCLVRYRPHWYTIWSVFKAVFAIVISPYIIFEFFVSKRHFITLMSWLWPHLDIFTPDGKLYLRRWFMTPKGQSYLPRFLHLILLSDEGRDPHDHPGEFTTTILMNGYDEEIYFPYGRYFDGEEFRQSPEGVGRPGSPYMRQVRQWETYVNGEGHTHAVKLIGPTLTWVVGWRKGKPWGFWKLDESDPMEDVWIESNEYGEKGEERKSWTLDGK